MSSDRSKEMEEGDEKEEKEEDAKWRYLAAGELSIKTRNLRKRRGKGRVNLIPKIFYD